MTKESNLLLRWSFDEGSGSNSQNLIGTGLDVILHPGVTWGNEANGTAKSGYSLDLSSGTSRASVIHDARLQASNDFSILLVQIQMVRQKILLNYCPKGRELFPPISSKSTRMVEV